MKSEKNVLEITLRLFYSFKFIILLCLTWTYFNGQSDGPVDWLWPIQWLVFFKDALFPIVSIFFTGIFFCVLATFSPFKVSIKILEGIFFFLSCAIFYSHGKIDHGIHGLIYASFYISLIGEDRSIQTLLMRYAIGIFSFSYGLSGLWKLRFLLEMKKISELSHVLPYQLALNIIQSGEKTVFALRVLEFSPFTNSLLWTGVLFVELFGLLILKRLHFFKYWGFLIIIFHFMTAIVMDIIFWEAQVLILIFLYYIWFQKEENSLT